MEERDEKLLRHIGLYHFTLRVVIERRIFEDNKRACDNVITRLRKAGLLVSRPRALPNGLSYYQLTPKATKELGFPEYRAKAPAGQALPDKLAVLWFCCMTGTQRRIIEDDELSALFSGQIFPGPHCYQVDGEDRRVYRIFPPSADDDYQLRQVQDHLERVTREGCYEWLECGAYGVVLLTETSTRKEKLYQEIGSKNLQDRTSFIVEVAPTPQTLKEMIDALPPSPAPNPPSS